MANALELAQPEESVQLKDPELSALLAWLIPGLGHWHQGRRAKAAMFFVCIMGTFLYGLYLGGSPDVGWGRVVYFSQGTDADGPWWLPCRGRLQYLGQIAVGLPAMPALIQAYRADHGRTVWWGGFMAPPRLPNGPQIDPNVTQPTLSELHLKLARFFDLGTAYTFIAGLLNILAIYDAWGGPVFGERTKKEETDDEEQDDDQQPA